MVHGTCKVHCIYEEKSDSTNDMKAPSVAQEPPRAAGRVVLNTEETARWFPQEQTYRLSAAVL